MHIPLTITVLLLLTIAMLLLRITWDRVPHRLRLVLIATSIALVLLQAFFAATKWGTISDRLNTIIYWLAVAAYELLVLLFSRLSPRWLTSACSTILLVLVFAASVVLTLTELFDPSTIQKVPVGNHLFYEVRPWRNTGAGTKGVDLIVSYRPPLAPFLRHKISIIAFNDVECNSHAAFAIPSLATKTVLGRCPRWPAETVDASAESLGTVDRIHKLH